MALEVMMFTTNPFTPLTAFMSPEVMHAYIVLMVLTVRRVMLQ